MTPELWTIAIMLGIVVLYFPFNFRGTGLHPLSPEDEMAIQESELLLRGPGEGLRRRLIETDETLVADLAVPIMLALVVYGLVALLAHWLGFRPATSLGLIGAGVLVVLLPGVWRITHYWKKKANLFLGWYGERLTAEKLQPLHSQGYRIFHDMPCETGKQSFNIDHVVVGPTGVCIIEVKTRRKGAARAGFNDHEVSFNGTMLEWPWGPDRKSVQQALNEADWLAKWIFQRTGLRTPVKAVLAIPGWYVRESPSPLLRVVNPAYLSDAVAGRGEALLTSQQIDLLSRQIDQSCRDVAD